MLWKFDFKNIGIASTNSTMSPATLSSMCEVIVHEIAHQLEKVGARKPGTHDEIFNELMKANFAKLLNNPK
jgi:predicted SprT family Zn-dependent metalloprotease